MTQWLRRSIHRLRRVIRPRRRLIAARTWLVAARSRAAFRSLVRRGISVPALTTEAVPIIMCMWRRPDRFLPTLEMIAGQASPPSLDLYVWNNDSREHEAYARALSRWSPSGALNAVHLHSNRTNVGGAARFLVVRALRRSGYTGPVILLDDDQQIAPDFVRRLLDAWRPKTMAGVWAWRIHGDYWDRSEAEDGESATYVGTGGAVVDADLAGAEELVTTLPLHRLFLEDMWLSAFALRHGWELRGVHAEYGFTDLAGNQWHAIADTKSQFFDEMGRPGLIPR